MFPTNTMTNTNVQFGSIIIDTDSDDCEELDGEEDDSDDYVVSKKRSEVKELRSKKPKGNFTMYPILESTRPVYKDCIQVNNTYTNVHIGK